MKWYDRAGLAALTLAVVAIAQSVVTSPAQATIIDLLWWLRH